MGEESLWANNCCLVATFRDCISFSMQHGHVLKKLHFDLLTTFPRVVGVCVCVCVCVGGVYGQNICYHVSAFENPFNLICNMTMF